MNGTELLILVVVAAICGAIGQSLGGASGGGLVTSIAVGFVGALLGVWIFPVVWSVIGGALFATMLSFLSAGSRYEYLKELCRCGLSACGSACAISELRPGRAIERAVS